MSNSEPLKNIANLKGIFLESNQDCRTVADGTILVARPGIEVSAHPWPHAPHPLPPAGRLMLVTYDCLSSATAIRLDGPFVYGGIAQQASVCPLWENLPHGESIGLLRKTQDGDSRIIGNSGYSLQGMYSASQKWADNPENWENIRHNMPEGSGLFIGRETFWAMSDREGVYRSQLGQQVVDKGLWRPTDLSLEELLHLPPEKRTAVAEQSAWKQVDLKPGSLSL
jgi:hypothetical protein